MQGNTILKKLINDFLRNQHISTTWTTSAYPMVNFLVYRFQSIKVDCERKEWFPILFHRDYITTTKSVCRCEILDLQWLVICYFYRPQRSCGKVIFSEACVKNFVHRRGVCLGACWDTPPPPHPGQTPPWADTPQADTPRADTPRQTPSPSRRLLQRTLRILLECILFISFISRDVCLLNNKHGH